MHAKPRQFSVNDSVFVKNFTSKEPKFLPGIIVDQTGPISYKVLSDLGIKPYHVDQTLPTECDFQGLQVTQTNSTKHIVSNEQESHDESDTQITTSNCSDPIDFNIVPPIQQYSNDVYHDVEATPLNPESTGFESMKGVDREEGVVRVQNPESDLASTVLRRSNRIRTKPNKLNL